MSDKVLDEKAIELILNFKPTENVGEKTANEILKLKSEIKKVISSLVKDKQEILALRYFQNMPLDKIAQKVGKPQEEVNQILLSGIDEIKENIKRAALELSQVQKIIKEPDFKISQVPPNANARSLWVSIISLIVFVSVFIIVYSFLQKHFSTKTPLLKQLSSISSDFVSEQFVNRKILKQVQNAKIGNPNKIIISGSTSVLTLSKQLENSFHLEYPEYKFDLISSDSDKGIHDLIKGDIDIANSSRPVTFTDQKRATNNGLELVENRVALDALIIIVNNKNPIQEISLDDLEAIFSGEVKNWLELNMDMPRNVPEKLIVPVVREKGSGTNEFAISRILQGNDFPPSISRKNSIQELISFISDNESAIGFVNSTNYSWENKNIKYLKVKNYENSLSVSPFEGKKLDEHAIRYGDYPLAHYLYLITLTQATKNTQEFIEWVLGDKGQGVVRASGLLPVVNEEE